MTAHVIDGRAVASRITEEVRADVAQLVDRGRPPYLAAVQVGEPPTSRLYVRNQSKRCEDAGIRYSVKTLPSDIDQRALEETLRRLNAHREVTGIILQMPLPAGFDIGRLQCAIDPIKDVEGVHSVNLGRLTKGDLTLGPCTAMAALELIRETRVPIEGADAVVVGHSGIVGKPLAVMLVGLNATTAAAHVYTKDLSTHTRRADILVVATGRAQKAWLRYKRALAAGESPEPPDLSPLVTADMIKPGAVVIDVGTNRLPVNPIGPNGSKMITRGDVDFDAVKEVASHITPVPGGVGPVTVAMLLRNTVTCARAQL